MSSKLDPSIVSSSCRKYYGGNIINYSIGLSNPNKKAILKESKYIVFLRSIFIHLITIAFILALILFLGVIGGWNLVNWSLNSAGNILAIYVVIYPVIKKFLRNI